MSLEAHDQTTAPEELEEDLDAFFRAGADVAVLDAPATSEPAPVLERLGPPPFRKSNFPLLGFLATVYEQVAGHVAPPEPDKPQGPTTPD
jgi:hypothetical protein